MCQFTYKEASADLIKMRDYITKKEKKTPDRPTSTFFLADSNVKNAFHFSRLHQRLEKNMCRNNGRKNADDENENRRHNDSQNKHLRGAKWRF